jgi:hypothetical protein
LQDDCVKASIKAAGAGYFAITSVVPPGAMSAPIQRRPTARAIRPRVPVRANGSTASTLADIADEATTSDQHASRASRSAPVMGPVFLMVGRPIFSHFVSSSDGLTKPLCSPSRPARIFWLCSGAIWV